MHTHPSDHDISSSEDRCKCPQCKNPLDFQVNYKKPLSSIHHYRHLKKRQAPPIKKDLLKDFAMKPKMLLKLEADTKLPATPVKYKPDRSKEANAGIFPPQYHMVSQSQRIKVAKDENISSDFRREERIRPKIRSNYEGLRLAEISQNPQNFKLVQRHTPSADRARVDASPSGQKTEPYKKAALNK